MIFVIGGTAQGKLQATLDATHYTLADVAFGEHDDLSIAAEKKIFYNLQSYIKRQMNEGISDFTTPIKELLLLNPNIIIICDEVGCGIVPIDKFEREYRETLGRLCCKIAAQAERVYRVFCGIPTIIKG